jgi:hypothetical protein|tara:strand:- start:169 stop:375 length:207 start_codon:yes stop_codon:yes gene_type:complete
MKWLWIIAGLVFVFLIICTLFVVDIFLLTGLLFKSIFGRLHTPVHYFHGLQPKQKKIKKEDSVDKETS